MVASPIDWPMATDSSDVLTIVPIILPRQGRKHWPSCGVRVANERINGQLQPLRPGPSANWTTRLWNGQWPSSTTTTPSIQWPLYRRPKSVKMHLSGKYHTELNWIDRRCSLFEFRRQRVWRLEGAQSAGTEYPKAVGHGDEKNLFYYYLAKFNCNLWKLKKKWHDKNSFQDRKKRRRRRWRRKKTKEFVILKDGSGGVAWRCGRRVFLNH